MVFFFFFFLCVVCVFPQPRFQPTAFSHFFLGVISTRLFSRLSQSQGWRLPPPFFPKNGSVFGLSPYKIVRRSNERRICDPLHMSVSPPTVFSTSPWMETLKRGRWVFFTSTCRVTWLDSNFFGVQNGLCGATVFWHFFVPYRVADGVALFWSYLLLKWYSASRFPFHRSPPCFVIMVCNCPLYFYGCSVVVQIWSPLATNHFFFLFPSGYHPLNQRHVFDPPLLFFKLFNTRMKSLIQFLVKRLFGLLIW